MNNKMITTKWMKKSLKAKMTIINSKIKIKIKDNSKGNNKKNNIIMLTHKQI